MPGGPLRRQFLDSSLDGLGRRPTDSGGATACACVLVGGNDGQAVSHRLKWSSPGRCGDWLDTATVTVQGSESGSTRRARGGDSYLATSGDFLMATCADFLMATDRPSPRVQGLATSAHGFLSGVVYPIRRWCSPLQPSQVHSCRLQPCGGDRVSRCVCETGGVDMHGQGSADLDIAEVVNVVLLE